MGVEPFDLAEEMMIWAVPGLVTNLAHLDLGQVAVLTIIPSITVHTRDSHPGADTIDVMVSALLGRGFGLLADPDVTRLLALPVLPDSHVELRQGDTLLRITDGEDALYDGQLGTTPPGWLDSARRRGRLVVLFSNAIDLSRPDRSTQLADACATGAVIGALITITDHPDNE